MFPTREIFILKQLVMWEHVLKLIVDVISWDSPVLGNGFNNEHSIPGSSRVYSLGVKDRIVKLPTLGSYRA
jgi:protein-tyrosine phosphatase